MKELNYHIALDTSGMFTLTDEIRKVLSLTDLVLLDIKHIDDEKCKELVGCSNKLELDFARYLSNNNIPIWIRQVIIPGITNSKDDLLELKHFIHSLKSVEKVELKPYHTLGRFKWENLNLEYQLDGIRQASDEDIKRAKAILEI